mmetsp:Transcript_520/g.678  ORF Transcript_520/g.678 Transcript_520/m.678 type:complete len:277 (-) Transcript_520:4507-5337(-)
MSYGGGGFDNSGSTTNFSSPSDKPRRSYAEQTLTPVTIRQILNAQSNGDSITLTDGRALTMCKIVCAVRSMEEASTNFSFLVEDGTGLCEVKQWLDVNDAAQNNAVEDMRRDCQDNVYVRVIGTVKDYDGKRTVVANNVRKCSTANELTHHMLEAIYSQLKYKQGPSTSGMGGAAMFSPMSNSVPNMNMQHNNQSFGGNQVVEQGGNDGMNPVEQAVINYIKRNATNEEIGCDARQMKTALAGQFSAQDIQASLTHLSNEGMLYTTVDENFYMYCQ